MPRAMSFSELTRKSPEHVLDADRARRRPRAIGLIRWIVAAVFLAACSSVGTTTATLHPSGPIRLPPANTVSPENTPRRTLIVSPSGTPEPSPTPQGPLSPGTPLTITYIDMMNASSGWGFGLAKGDGASRVLRTSDGGATWQDVTPPKTPPPVEFGRDPVLPAYQPAMGFFADWKTAWIVYYEYPFGSMNFRVDKNPVVVWHTEDGGEGWSHSAPLAIDMTGWVDDHEPWANTFSPVGLQFLEGGLTGWLLALVQSYGMGCCDAVLFRTEDGGATWVSISAPAAWGAGGMGSMVFADANVGWIAARREPGYSGSVALSTQDGGRTWTHVGSLWVPHSGLHPCAPNVYGQDSYCETYDPAHLPTGWIQLLGWIDGDGYAGVDLGADPSKDLLAVYSSGDGGLTWRWALLPSSSEPDPSFLEDSSGVDVFFLTARIGWVLDYLSGKLYRTLDAAQTWDEINTVTWNGELEFAGEIYGWALAWGSDSADEQPDPPSPVEFSEEYGLVRTFDGGSTWVLLEPRLAAP
jgi:photosystem II stability/assembly factor-like uncharacterized protein